MSSRKAIVRVSQKLWFNDKSNSSDIWPEFLANNENILVVL